MRPIKFRGKRVDTGKWVYGHLFNAPLTVENFGAGHLATPNDERITCIESDGVVFHVLPESVGQFTGLHDKNGKEIYEGDMVNFTGWKTENPFRIEWDGINCGFIIVGKSPSYVEETMHKDDMYEVIGNIHNNQEFLK